jgi:siroheme synthase (precorrin-2 oxidase/ferrochelatase)
MTLLPDDNHVKPVQDGKNKGNQLFPVFIKLNDLHTLLIGAGPIGLEKLTAVLNNSPLARVTIIAKEIIPKCTHLPRSMQG